MRNQVCCVIPNWNGKDSLAACLDSLLEQTLSPHIIVVENGSIDDSLEFLQKHYPQVELVVNETNLGFAGGVNSGIQVALKQDFPFIALFNNDAVADQGWLKELVKVMEADSKIGIVTCKFTDIKGEHLDSTGDMYTNWGLPYPRGRGETVGAQYDDQVEIFAASGGASLYRRELFEDVGLFDEDFFAYYEDVDISFRAQLRGWRIHYAPKAKAYHQIGATSGKIKGFTTYQAMKNQPLVLYKNVPAKYLFTIGWRFWLAHCLFFCRAVSRGQGWPALKGDLQATMLLFKKHSERKQIQKSRQVTDEYIWSIITHDLPPNAHALRSLRAKWWKLRRKAL